MNDDEHGLQCYERSMARLRALVWSHRDRAEALGLSLQQEIRKLSHGLVIRACKKRFAGRE